MRKFTKENARNAADMLREVIEDLGKEQGLHFALNGGTFTDDEVVLKIKVKLVDEDGGWVVGDSTNSMADRFAERNGIKYSTPHFIGSLWKISSGVAKVIEYKRNNKKYPVIIMVDGVRRKAAAGIFREELKKPDVEEFHTWYTIDPDDDCTTREQEAICDRVSEYMEAAFGGDLYDDFLEICEKHFLTGVAEAVSAKVYYHLFTLGNTLKDVIEYQKKLTSKTTKK